MLLALLFLVAAFLIFFDLIQPTYGDLQTKKGKQLSSENFLRDEQHVIDQAKKLIAQYQTESQAQDNLALAMPSGPSVANALAQVYGIAQNNNLTVQSIALSPPMIQLQNQSQGQASAGARGAPTSFSGSQIIKPMGTLSLQVTALGSYESFKNFASQLEANIRLFDLTGLSLQPVGAVATGKGSSAASNFFTYNITVVTYYQLP